MSFGDSGWTRTTVGFKNRARRYVIPRNYWVDAQCEEVSPDDAIQAARLLWRKSPARLAGVVEEALVQGCVVPQGSLIYGMTESLSRSHLEFYVNHRTYTSQCWGAEMERRFIPLRCMPGIMTGVCAAASALERDSGCATSANVTKAKQAVERSRVGDNRDHGTDTSPRAPQRTWRAWLRSLWKKKRGQDRVLEWDPLKQQSREAMRLQRFGVMSCLMMNAVNIPGELLTDDAHPAAGRWGWLTKLRHWRFR